MRNKIFQAQLNGMAFALMPKDMSALMEMANSETPRAENSIEVANNAVAYETRKNVAIISVDGGMAKKGTGGLCSSIASYETMIQKLDTAEADANVDTVLWRVDTGGGAVDGVDEVGERIFNSSKKNVTFYENSGHSGGIWAFTASKEIYASETTMLGSIGVVVSYIEDNEDDKRIDIVSKNAENKRCSLNGDCKDRIKSMLDWYENIFYSRVMRNRNVSKAYIKSTFDNGGSIFASQALESNFIDGITTFDTLLKSLQSNNTGSTIVPTASVSESLTSDNSIEINQGADMKFDRENLDATEASFNALVANRDTLTSRNDSLSMQLQTATTALEALEEEVVAEKASTSTMLSEAVVTRTARIQEAFATGVASQGTILAMLEADTDEKASEIALGADKTEALIQTDGGQQVDAWAGIVKKRGK